VSAWLNYNKKKEIN